MPICSLWERFYHYIVVAEYYFTVVGRAKLNYFDETLIFFGSELLFDSFIVFDYPIIFDYIFALLNFIQNWIFLHHCMELCYNCVDLRSLYRRPGFVVKNQFN